MISDEYIREAARLAVNYVSNRSMAVIIRDREGNYAVGSSICIHVADHLLLATAGHVIEEMRDERLILLPRGEPARQGIGFTTRSCGPEHPAPPSDLAWIEVDAADAKRHNLQFVPLEALKPFQEFEADRPFLVQGYPYATGRFTDATIDVEGTAGLTRMVEAGTIDPPVGPGEIAIEYPPRDHEEEPMREAPEPQGLSGGGVWWHPRHDETLIYTPESFRLVAITTRWDRERAVLLGATVEHWLELVSETLPDTEPVIGQFLRERR